MTSVNSQLIVNTSTNVNSVPVLIPEELVLHTGRNATNATKRDTMPNAV